MNRTIYRGRIASELILKKSKKEKDYCQFNIAVPRKNDKEVTDFFIAVAFNKTAVNLVEYCKKGSSIIIDGNTINDTYIDNSDERKYVTKIIAEYIEYLEPKANNEVIEKDNKENTQILQIDQDSLSSDENIEYLLNAIGDDY